MQLSSDILSQFAKVTKDKTTTKQESIVYGTIIESNGEKYVQLDGSDLLTPMASTTNMSDGERVTVMIKNHMAVVTGNVTSPAVRDGDVDEKVSDVKKLVVEDLKATNAEIEKLKAGSATIENLEATNAEIVNLKAKDAAIENLVAKKADIENLNATNAEIDNLKAKDAAIENLVAKKADIETLNATYATIDFANIGQAAMEYFYATSGLIKDVVIDNGVITGNLVGVTIKGDIIEGNTVVADKLVIKGNDGLYYKLNTDGMKVEAEQTDYNSLNGSIITAKSITATKISVEDLVAFDATIGGFNITEKSIYSGVKASVDNTTTGIYLDKDGQIAFGDSKNFLKYYKDASGQYRLEISAASIKMGTSGTSVEDAITDAKNAIDNLSIGGRNLLAKTDVLYERTSASSGVNNYQFGLADGYDMQSLIGKTVTASLYLHSPGNRASETPDNATMSDRFGAHMTVRWLDSTGQNSMAVVYPCTDLLALDRTRSRVSSTTTLTPPSGYDTLGLVSMAIQLYAKPAPDNPEVWQIGYPKLELGNKATDWSPAPEDAEQKIAELSAEMVLQAGQISFNASAIEEVQSSYHGIKPASGTIVQADGLLAGQGIHVSSRIDPIQTGSGDPYPAGCGKNLLPTTVTTKTINGVTFTVNGDGSITANGTATEYASFNFAPAITLKAGSYVLSGCPSGGGDGKYDLRLGASGEYRDFGTGKTFTLSNDTEFTVSAAIMIRRGYTASNLTFFPMIRPASITDATYAPYSNIRPITGRTGAVLTKCGKNLLPNTAGNGTTNGITFTLNTDGSVTASGTATANAYYDINKALSLPAGQYALSGCPSSSNGVNYLVYAQSAKGDKYDSGKGVNLDAAADETWYVRIKIASGITVSNLTFYPMIRLASVTDETYEPYRGDTFALDFGQTVYGGVMDWNTGVLTVDRAALTLNGSESWTNGYAPDGKNNRFELRLVDSKFGYAGNTSQKLIDEAICDAFAYQATKAIPQVSKFRAVQTTNQIWILFNPSQDVVPLEDVSAWKAWLAVNPITVVMPLIEPYTIQLTPQEITALAGLNTVYSDLDWNDVEFGHESRSGLGAASGYELDQVVKRVTQAELDIDAQEGRIEAKVSRDEFNALGDRVLGAESALTVQAEAITANSTYIETVNQSAANAQNAANAAQNAAAGAQGTANNAVTRVTTAEQRISAVEGAITTKVSQTDFNALGNRVSEAEGSITTQAGQIAAKVEKTEFDALGNKVNANTSAITQTAEAIRSEVANSVEGLQSQIDQTPEQIRMAVSQVQVGGTNLLRNTGTLKTANHIIDESGASARGKCTEDEFGGFHVVCKNQNIRCWMGDYAVTPGQSYAMSVRYKINSGTPPIQFQYIFKSASGTDLYFWNSVDHSTTSTVTEDGWTVLRSVVEAPDNPAVAKVSLAIRTGLDGKLYTCDYNIRRPKFEIGNKVTDWSPAPEDTDAAIDGLSATIDMQDGKITSNATAITTVNTAATNAQNAANTAQSLANTAKAAADAAQNAANSAQDTANAAQNAANGAQGTANNAVTRVTTAEQRISAVEGAITSKVEKTEFDALGNKVNANTSAITQTAEAIRSEVASSVSGLQTQIDQTDEQVLILAGRTVGGTNMVKLSTVTCSSVVGSTLNTSFGVISDVDETWYYRSRKMIAIPALSGGYSITEFYGIPLKQGVQYTVSFNMWGGTGISGAVMTVNVWNEGRGTDFNMTQIGVVPNTPTRYQHTFACPASDNAYRLRFLCFSGNNATIYLSDVKLEEGNTATAWSAHPEEYRAGSNVLITEKQVKIVSPQTVIGIPSADGETMVAQFDENGLTANVITAGNIAYRYNGPAEVWINPNAETVNDAVYRSLADLFARLRGRFLDMGGLTIHMQGNDYGVMMLQRVVGGAITIYGNDVTLNGGLAIEDCTSRVYVNNLNVVANGVNQAAWVLGRAAWVQWHGCTFNGNGAERALFLYDGGSGMVWDCGLYNATNLMYAGHASDVSVIGARGGNCTYFAATDGCTIKFSGTRPDGAWAQHNISLVAPADPSTLGINYGSAQPSVPTIQTASWNYLYSDSYARGWNAFTDDDVRQGYNGQIIHGVMWFDAAAIRSALSGKTINQASLRLYMHSGVGRSVAVSVQLYGSNVSYDRTTSPALTTSYGTISTTEPGVVNEITIPTQVITDIVNGTIQALVLKSDDTTYHNGKSYSRNYARFSGSTSADGNTCPRLTVVYQ